MKNGGELCENGELDVKCGCIKSSSTSDLLQYLCGSLCSCAFTEWCPKLTHARALNGNCSLDLEALSGHFRTIYELCNACMSLKLQAQLNENIGNILSTYEPCIIQAPTAGSV